MSWLLVIILLISFSLNILGGWYLYKFAKIILLFEDDLSDTIEALNDSEKSIENILSLQLFFSDENIKNIVGEAMDSITMSKFNINKMAKRFTERSKQKYIIIDEIKEDIEDEEEEEDISHSIQKKYNKGTILHVGKKV